jgi:hypothetical protein
MLKDYLEKAKMFVVDNKVVLIKGSAVVLGAVVGIVIANIITAQPEVINPDDWDLGSEKDPDNDGQ